MTVRKVRKVEIDAVPTQFTIYCKHIGDPDSKAWPERYNLVTANPLQWACITISNFNAALYRGELPREIVKVVVEPNEVTLAHKWRKTNLVTLKDGTDRYECTRCGAKGTRYSMFSGVSVDNKKQLHCR